jgi:hypothetical protein
MPANKRAICRVPDICPKSDISTSTDLPFFVPSLSSGWKARPWLFAGFCQTLGCLRNRFTGPLPEQRGCVVSKRAEYTAKADEHSHLAVTCQSEEARKIHRDLAEWFLLLADDGSRSNPKSSRRHVA